MMLSPAVKPQIPIWRSGNKTFQATTSHRDPRRWEWCWQLPGLLFQKTKLPIRCVCVPDKEWSLLVMCLGVDAPGHFAPRRSSRYHAYCNPRIMFFCLRKKEKTFLWNRGLRVLGKERHISGPVSLWRFYYGELYSNCGSSLTLSESNKDSKLEVWSTGFTGRGVFGWGSGISHTVFFHSVNQIHTTYGYRVSRFTPTTCVSRLGSGSSKYKLCRVV